LDICGSFRTEKHNNEEKDRILMQVRYFLMGVAAADALSRTSHEIGQGVFLTALCIDDE